MRCPGARWWSISMRTKESRDLFSVKGTSLRCRFLPLPQPGSVYNQSMCLFHINVSLSHPPTPSKNQWEKYPPILRINKKQTNKKILRPACLFEAKLSVKERNGTCASRPSKVLRTLKGCVHGFCRRILQTHLAKQESPSQA